jgi:hypothetical protein
MKELSVDKTRFKRSATRAFTFDADIELTDEQISDLEWQIQEAADKKFGNTEIIDYNFRIPVRVTCVIIPED